MYYIGIDVGGTNLKAGLVREDGQILAVERTPLAFENPEQFARTLAQLGESVLRQAGGSGIGSGQCGHRAFPAPWQEGIFSIPATSPCGMCP